MIGQPADGFAYRAGARHWKQAGGDIESLRNILGHAHATTTIDLHGSLSMEDILSTYDRLRGHYIDD